MDLTELVIACLGKRIDDPLATLLSSALGKRPFKSATPNRRCDIGDRKRLGLEVVAEMVVYNRAYWPYRKQGRTWMTWVTTAFLYPNYQGVLPAGFEWQMDDAALSRKFDREASDFQVWFTLPPPREGLRAKTVLGSEGRPAHLILSIMEEPHYATIHPDSKPENCVEDAFLATWCALAGLLRDGRVKEDAMASLRARDVTPLAFFSTALDGLLWGDDVKTEYQVFCRTYVQNLFRSDIGSAFGKRNFFRGETDPKTQDDWTHYEQIERCFETRMQDWHDGRLAPVVRLSRPAN